MHRSSALALGVLACTHAPAPGEIFESTTTYEAPVGEPSSETGTVDRDRGSATDLVIRGAEVIGLGRVDMLVRGGRIVEVGENIDVARRDESALIDLPSIVELDATGQFIAPAFIDSHVHLAYAFNAETLAAGGVAAAVDLAAPIESLAESHAPLQQISAGPMITAIEGYPTQSWGAGGFGLEVANALDATRAVDRLVAAGAGVIKIPVGELPALSSGEMVALIDRAHHHGLKVVAHALSDADAYRAATAGADVLAHTPTEPLGEDTVQAWSSRAVISTLDAFGGTATTLDNFRRLRSAGATMLYGTDLGNTGIPAIDHNELELLAKAGLDGDAILAAGTSIPASFWGFEGLGTLGEGARASFLVLDADPRVDPQILTAPALVYIDGVLQPESWTAGDAIKD